MEQRLIPERFRVLSGSMLKLIAVFTMLIDHVAANFLQDAGIVLFRVFNHDVTLYYCMRSIGRLAFPLFAFLLVEGFLHTHDKKRYGISLAILAVVSELPWNLVHEGKLFCGTQNVMFTLLAGFLALCAIERFKDNAAMLFVVISSLFVAVLVLKTDYSCRGYCFVILLYMLRNMPVVRAVAGSAVLPSLWVGGLAFVPIAFYNGKRGFIRGRFWQYMFYAVYPVHMFIMYLFKYVIQ